jgi:uncharacterized integral membrane protein
VWGRCHVWVFEGHGGRAKQAGFSGLTWRIEKGLAFQGLRLRKWTVELIPQRLPGKSNMLQYITAALAIMALVIIGIFAIQNLGAVEVSFLFWSANVSKIIIILATYLLGMLTGGSLWHLIRGYFSKS